MRSAGSRIRLIDLSLQGHLTVQVLRLIGRAVESILPSYRFALPCKDRHAHAMFIHNNKRKLTVLICGLCARENPVII
jgi:hypothetical protein